MQFQTVADVLVIGSDGQVMMGQFDFTGAEIAFGQLLQVVQDGTVQHADFTVHAVQL